MSGNWRDLHLRARQQADPWAPQLFNKPAGTETFNSTHFFVSFVFFSHLHNSFFFFPDGNLNRNVFLGLSEVIARRLSALCASALQQSKVLLGKQQHLSERKTKNVMSHFLISV